MHRSFAEMIDTLRAGYAAGMSCQITLTPDSASMLADILEDHQGRLRDETLTALAQMGQECDEKEGQGDA